MDISNAAGESGLGDAAYFIRAPIVNSVGEGVEVLATVSGDASKVAAVRQDNMLATCFHPEISSDDSWLKFFLESVAGIAPAGSVATPSPTSAAPWHALPPTDSEVDTAVKRAFAVFQQGGVIMDVVDGEQVCRRRADLAACRRARCLVSPAPLRPPSAAQAGRPYAEAVFRPPA